MKTAKEARECSLINEKIRSGELLKDIISEIEYQCLKKRGGKGYNKIATLSYPRA